MNEADAVLEESSFLEPEPPPPELVRTWEMEFGTFAFDLIVRRNE